MRDDHVRVRHILDAAHEAIDFATNRERTDLDSDRKLALSLVRLIEVVGEAASQVSPEFRAIHPEVPWTEMVAMRNRIVHAYFDIDLDRIWDTVSDDLPMLISLMEGIDR